MTQQYRLEELLKLCSSLGIFFNSVVRRWQHWLTTASCVCVPWAADLSHLCDAKLALRYCRCSFDVASPPCASWRAMKEPVRPNQPSPVMVCACLCARAWFYRLPVAQMADGQEMWEYVLGIPETPLFWAAEALGGWAATHSSAIRTSEVVAGLGC